MSELNVDLLKKSFDTDGFVYLPGFIKPNELELFKLHLKRFISEKISGMKKGHYLYEDNNDASTLKQMQDLEKYDPFFQTLATGSKFMQLAKQLLEEDVVCKTVEFFNKPPKIGKPTPPHQDGYYFMIVPQQAVTMWLALEDVSEETGCVKYVKGSQLKGIRNHNRTKTPGFSQGIVDFGTEDDLRNEVSFPVKAGDLLAHHSLTIHRAGANTTLNKSRNALGLIYFGHSVVEDIETKENYAKQLIQEAKILNK